jgi:hypothetical protein
MQETPQRQIEGDLTVILWRFLALCFRDGFFVDLRISARYRISRFSIR